MPRKKLTTEEFIKKAKAIHGDKYDYSKVTYTGSKNDVCIICPIHGEFYQTPSVHLSGGGCKACAYSKKGRKCLSTNAFIEKAQKVHGNKYDYSKVEYVNNRTKVCIICPKHGEFWQEPRAHLQGCGCIKCGYKNRESGRPKYTNDDFIALARDVHKDKYDYDKVIYNGSTIPVTITCPIHGDFLQQPVIHLRGCGCPYCGHKETLSSGVSKGESEIINILNKHKIKYNTQFPIESSVNITGWMYVDFYIPSLNVIIEYNGKQHYEKIKIWEKNFERQQNRDEELRQYCIDNNIKLIEIKYNEDVWVELEAQLFNENINHS